MRLPISFFDSLRDKIPLSDIVRQKLTLTRKGKEYSGLCPFHSEKTPSFTVNDQKRFYHCFGCGAHGDVLKFTSETSGMTITEAAKKLAADYSIPIPQLTKEQRREYDEVDELHRILDLAKDFFSKNLNSSAKDYLYNRGLDEPTIKHFAIGYAEGANLISHLEGQKIPLTLLHKAGLIGKDERGNIYPIFRKRIMFPIHNIYGKVVGFGGRALGEFMPKYLNSPETVIFNKSEILYGEDKAIAEGYKQNQLIIVEGYLDVITLQKSGFTNTVASLGTAVTQQHLQKMWKTVDEIIFALDGDEAGLKAMHKALILLLPLLKQRRLASFMLLPNKQDPDQLIKLHGANKFTEYLSSRLPTSEMIWYLETNNMSFTTAEQRALLESKLNEYINQLTESHLAKHMRFYIKGKLWQLGQNSSKSAKKSANLNSAVARGVLLPEMLSPLALIEYNLFALILHKPELLHEDLIYQEFENIEFFNPKLIELQSYILEEFFQHSAINLAKIKDYVQKPGFSEVFIILFSDEGLFLDILSLSNKALDAKKLWELFLAKYELHITTEEYNNFLLKHIDDFAKIQAYRTQIAAIQSKILQLGEQLTS